MSENGERAVTDGGVYSYDYVALAGGSATNYFGNDTVAEHSYGLKDLGDADRLRNHILAAFGEAARTDDPERRRVARTFVVVGDGATGVELAGQLSLLPTNPAQRVLERGPRPDPSSAGERR